jgi:hypothetical protein
MGYICDYYLKDGQFERVYYGVDPCWKERHNFLKSKGKTEADLFVQDCFHDSEEPYYEYVWDGSKWVENEDKYRVVEE